MAGRAESFIKILINWLNLGIKFAFAPTTEVIWKRYVEITLCIVNMQKDFMMSNFLCKYLAL